jgi:hypothetical protein
LFLALPGSALWPYNWPYREGEDLPWSQGRRVRAVIAGADTGAHIAVPARLSASGIR